MEVVAVGRDNTGKLGDGMLEVIDNLIDQTTGTIKLKATFQNDDLRLWPGEFVNARLLLTTRENGLVVPTSVVQRGPQGSYAFVIKDNGTAEMRQIKVAQDEDGLSLIDDGLKAGESVVVDGQYKLQEGSKVVVSNHGGDNKNGDGSQHHGKLGNHDGKTEPSPTPAASPAVAASR